MDFIISHHLQGLLIGALTFLVIGLFHPLVIKAEYYIGTRAWILFLLMGIVGGIVSVCTQHPLLSIVAGVFAFSSFWGILEVFEQAERVRKGWFPANPKKKKG